MIYAMSRLTEKDTDVLSLIEEARKALQHRLSVPRRWSGLLRRSTIGRAMRGSNSIEGYRIAKRDVVAAAVGETVDASEETKRAVECYRRAMTYVLQASKDTTFLYSTGVIKALHFMLQEYDMNKNPGLWRPGGIHVENEKGETVYEGPDRSLVAGFMDELIARIIAENTATPTIVSAAMAHLNLAMIHPFSDGNGRMARCVQTLVLGRAGILEPPFSSVEEYLGENQQAYYDVLTKVGQGSWHPDNDTGPWMQFSLRAHYYQAHTLIRRAKESDTLYNALADMVAKRGLPERMTFALFDAASGFTVRNGTYRLAAEVTDQVASRDLRMLVEAGLLVASGEKRARKYEGSAELREVQKESADLTPIADPYADSSRTVAMATSTTTTTGRPTVLIKGVTAPSSTGPNQQPAQFQRDVQD